MKASKDLWKTAYGATRAEYYEDLIRCGVGPAYRTALESLVEAASLQSLPRAPRVLDLGAGTGNVTEVFLKAFPQASVTLLDGSPAMLSMARKRFAEDKRVSFMERDFRRPAWTSGLGKFDMVASVGAIHHLNAEEKKVLFGRILGLLEPGGFFVCGDPIRGDSPALDRLNETAWARLTQRNVFTFKRERLPLKKILQENRRIQRAEGDDPSPLAEQMEWLREQGFLHVDCFWKLFAFAVFGGVKG